MFDLIFRVVEKMFDVHDDRFMDYIQSIQKESDEFEAIQMVSDLLDDFELCSRRTLLSHRSVIEKHMQAGDFLSDLEKKEFTSQIHKTVDQVFSKKMGDYQGKVF